MRTGMLTEEDRQANVAELAARRAGAPPQPNVMRTAQVDYPQTSVDIDAPSKFKVAPGFAERGYRR